MLAILTSKSDFPVLCLWHTCFTNSRHAPIKLQYLSLTDVEYTVLNSPMFSSSHQHHSSQCLLTDSCFDQKSVIARTIDVTNVKFFSRFTIIIVWEDSSTSPSTVTLSGGSFTFAYGDQTTGEYALLLIVRSSSYSPWSKSRLASKARRPECHSQSAVPQKNKKHPQNTKCICQLINKSHVQKLYGPLLRIGGFQIIVSVQQLHKRFGNERMAGATNSCASTAFEQSWSERCVMGKKYYLTEIRLKTLKEVFAAAVVHRDSQ